MDRKEKRNADAEFRMECFVTEEPHAHENTKAAAYSSNAHQDLLRDAPKIFLCLKLVRKHKEEPKNID